MNYLMNPAEFEAKISQWTQMASGVCIEDLRGLAFAVLTNANRPHCVRAFSDGFDLTDHERVRFDENLANYGIHSIGEGLILGFRMIQPTVGLSASTEAAIFLALSHGVHMFSTSFQCRK